MLQFLVVLQKVFIESKKQLIKDVEVAQRVQLKTVYNWVCMWLGLMNTLSSQGVCDEISILTDARMSGT